MSLPISSLAATPFSMSPRIPAEGLPGQAPAVNFQQVLLDSLSQANQLEHQAQENIEARLLGKDITNAEVYTSLRKSDMALKMMVQVRNKLVDAYQEIQQMRM